MSEPLPPADHDEREREERDDAAAAPLRRHRARRAATRSAVGLALLLILLSAVLVWLVVTAAGARFVFARVTDLIPGQLSAGSIEGPIRGPLTLHDFHYKTERFEITAQEIRLEWSPWALRRRLIDIGALAGHGIRVTIFPSATASQHKLTDINFRYNLLVRGLDLRDIQVLRPGDVEGTKARPIVIDRIVMQTAAWMDGVRIKDVTVTSPDFDLDVRGWMRPVGDYPLDLQVVWGYRPPEKQPPFAGRGRLSGTLRALRVDQDLERPFPAAVHGTIAEALFAPHFHGSVDFRDLQPRAFAATSIVTQASGHLVGDATGVDAFGAQGTGRVTVEGWGTMDVRELRLRHDADRWHFDRLTVQRPGRQGSLTWVGDFVTPAKQAARFAGRASWQRMTWPLDGANPAVTSPSGSAQIDGTSTDYRLAVDGRFSFPNVPEGHWRGTGRGNQRQLVASTLTGDVLGGRVAGSGKVSWKPTVAWSSQAVASGIRPSAAWPAVPVALDGGTWKLSAHGDRNAATIESLRIDNARGSLQGTGAVAWAPAFTWRADAQTHGISPASVFPQVPPSLVGGDWHVVGSGTDQRADLTTLAGAFLGGSVDAAGRVAWKPGVSWNLQGSAKNLDPGKAFAGWPGSLSGAFRTQAVAAAGGVRGEVVVEHVAGTLRERPLAAQGTLLLRPGTMSVSGVAGTWGAGKIALAGEISPRLGLDFDVEQLDLAAVDPRAKGVVTAKGTVHGSAATPVIAADLQGQAVAFAGVSAKTVGGRLALDLAPGGTIDVNLQGKDVTAFGQAAQTLAVVARGTREAHTITATASGQGVTFDLAATGAFLTGGSSPGERLAAANAAPARSIAGWSGTLTRLTASSQDTGRWDLAGPASVLLSAPEIRVQQLCWVSGGARLCGDLDWRSNQAMQLAATVTELPLKLIQPFLPADVELTGNVSGEAHLHSVAGGVLMGDAVLRPSAGASLWNASRGDETKVTLEGGEVRLVADAGGVSTRADLRLSGGGTLQGSVVLPGYRMGRAAAAQPLQGHITAGFADLRFVQALAPVLADTTGQARADLALSGTLAAPALAGSASVSGAHASVPSLGLQLQQIELTARGNGSGPLAVHGTLRSGTGTLTFDGTTPLVPSTKTPLHLTLQGENVQVANLENAHIVANPRLQLTYDLRLLHVTGVVVVPQAHVVYAQGKPGAVQPSQDVVFVGTEKPAVVQTGMQIDARIRIVLGRDVLLEALGLRTQLGGSLQVVDRPGEGTTATGQLDLTEGTFKAYGQDLTIERGRVFFAGGSIFDPGIDVRASRRIEESDVTVGINARGTVHRPEVTVWSEPAMDQSQALSYLVLGRPMDSVQPDQGSLLTTAATSLGIHGGDLLAKKIGTALGMQEAGIETGNTLQDAAFVLGRYLSPRLYLSYGIGIFDASSTLRIRYLVSEHLHIQATTGARTSGDVLYTFEHGHPTPQELGRERYHPLRRVTKEELTTPSTVPVGSEGAKAPPAVDANKAKQQAKAAAQQNDTGQPAPPQPTPPPPR